ncbi:hypothetical protein [Vibrio phage vB_ValS_PJ32]|nr:hypothetical protein [Vibrio phage vB_ValS_PJ32]
MRQHKRKELESSIQGLLVKRFNHYLYKQSVISKRVIALMKQKDLDPDLLRHRLAISAQSLDKATTAEKSNEWAIDGLNRISLSNDLITSISGYNSAFYGPYADSLANKVKYALNLALLFEGVGILGHKSAHPEQTAIDCMLTASHIFNNTEDMDYKAEVTIIMDRAKILNWLVQSRHVKDFGILWATAVRASVLTLTHVLTVENEPNPVAHTKLKEQLDRLIAYETKLNEDLNNEDR